jgi:assimilatory nitrate reductase electron transfer subunit
MSARTDRHHVAVVGNGMAGARFAAELRAREPRRPVVVFGAEPGRAYNRILLSDLLAGKVSEDDLPLAEPAGALDLRAGVEVVAVDPERKVVSTADGGRTRYDVLVFATGSRAVVPPIDGLWPTVTSDPRMAGSTDCSPPPLLAGAVAFRTLADCRQILAAAEHAGEVVVLGGGLLGLEAARALAHRGLAVTVVHARGHLMERQLDLDASRILVRALAEIGVSVRLDAVTSEVVGEDRVRGVRLEDGTEIPADLLVIACGVRPNPDLAVKAGLRVNRGIVVDDCMRTSDRSIYAIGDCAEHRGRVYGLVAPAWEQARVAAEVISGTDTGGYAGSRLVTRLKASGIDLAAMGDPHAPEEAAEVVTFADPARLVYQKVVIRDRRLVAAILLGDNPTVGTLTQVFDRQTPLPADPRSLLFGRSSSSQAVGTGALPVGSTVCQCNGVTAGAIMRAFLDGARTTAEVASTTRAGTGCGSCRATIDDYLGCLSAAAGDGDMAGTTSTHAGVVA